MDVSTRYFKHLRKQSGMTLIEIIVTILILSIGLLGLAALQNTSLTLSHQAYLRTHTSLLAQDLIARALSNSSATPYTVNGTLNSPASNCYANTCSPSALRVHDLYHWQQQVYSIFPDVKQCAVSFDNTKNLYTLILAWRDSGDSSNEFQYKFRVSQ